MNKECMNKMLLLRSLYTGPHHPSFLINSSVLSFWSLSICHEGINGTIIASFRLTLRIIEWQSRKEPYRWSPKLLMTSEFLKRKPEADFSKLPFIWNPNNKPMQMIGIFYTVHAIFLSVRISCTGKDLYGISNPFTYIISLNSYNIFYR